MSEFLRVQEIGKESYFWAEISSSGDLFFRGDNGQEILNWAREERPTARETLEATFPLVRYEHVKPRLEIGEYHPRIWRPGRSPSPQVEYKSAWADSVHAADTIFVRLQELVRFIEPSSKNHKAYGHECRNLLLLAATEVESGWKGVLRANNYSAKSPWTIRNYVELLDAMRLADWEIAFGNYDDFKAIRPFHPWAAGSPGTPLAWYQAYNAVKHDREAEFAQGTLEHVLSACAAVYVMVIAQFGQFAPRGDGVGTDLRIVQMHNAQEARFHNVFRPVKEPIWLLEELYAPPAVAGRSNWQEKTLWP